MSNYTDSMRISFREPSPLKEEVDFFNPAPEPVYRYEFLFDGFRVLDKHASPPIQEDEAVVKVRLGSSEIFVAIKIVGVQRG